MTEFRSPRRATRRGFGTVAAVLATAALALTLGLAVAHAQAPAPAPASSAPDSAAAVGSQSDKAARARKRATSSDKAMDLHAPPLTHVYPRKELQQLLAPEDPNQDQPIVVSVETAKYQAPVPGGPGNQFVAIPWAILHPTQAWRIFTPLLEP